MPVCHTPVAFQAEDELTSVFSPPPQQHATLPPAYVLDTSEKVLEVLWRQQLLITFNTSTRVHSVWKYECRPQGTSHAISGGQLLGDVTIQPLWVDKKATLGNTAAMTVFVWYSTGEMSPAFIICWVMGGTGVAITQVTTTARRECVCVDPPLDVPSGSEEEDVDTSLSEICASDDSFQLTWVRWIPCTSAVTVAVPSGSTATTQCKTLGKRWLLLTCDASGASVSVHSVDSLLCIIPVVGTSTAGLITALSMGADDTFGGMVQTAPLYAATAAPSIQRLSVSFDVPHALVSQCLLAVDAVVSLPESIRLRCDVLAVSQLLATGANSLQLHGGCSMDVVVTDDPCWSAFVTTLYALLSGIAPSSPRTPPRDAWSQLLASDYHANFCMAFPGVLLGLGEASPTSAPLADTSTATFPMQRDARGFMATHLSACFTALHFVYEDCKLDTRRAGDALLLARLLLSLSTVFASHNLADVYHRDFPGVSTYHLPLTPASVCALVPDQPDVFTALRALWSSPEAVGSCDARFGVSALCPFDALPELACPRLFDMLSLHAASVTARTAHDINSVVYSLVSLGYSSADLLTLPAGLSVPLFDAILACREDPPLDWPSPAYELIGRRDLAALVNNRSQPQHNAIDTGVVRVGCMSSICTCTRIPFVLR